MPKTMKLSENCYAFNGFAHKYDRVQLRVSGPLRRPTDPGAPRRGTPSWGRVSKTADGQSSQKKKQSDFQVPNQTLEAQSCASREVPPRPDRSAENFLKSADLTWGSDLGLAAPIPLPTP